MYCPSFENFDKEVTLSGTSQNKRQKQLEFQIFRCDYLKNTRPGESEKDCASSEEIDEYILDLEISIHVVHQIIDFSIYGREPTFSIHKYLGSTLLEKDYVITDELDLSLNTIESAHDFIQLGQSEEYEYYEVANHIRNKLFQSSYEEEGMIYNAKLGLDQLGTHHARNAYMLFDLIGDLGGVKELIILSFGWFLFPMSEHSFVMKAAKHLFLARTSDKQIFATQK